MHSERLKHALEGVAKSLASRPRELRGPFASSATELRHDCARSGYHEHDGCTCSDRDLLARSDLNR